MLRTLVLTPVFIAGLAVPAHAGPNPNQNAVAAHQKRACAAVSEAFDGFAPGSKVFRRHPNGQQNFYEGGVAFGCVPPVGP